MIFTIPIPSIFNLVNNLVNRFKAIVDTAAANMEFVFQNKNKGIGPQPNLSDLLTGHTQQLAGNENQRHEEFLKDYVHGLEEMMFMTHHKVRQPVANILGMVTLIDEYTNSPDELKTIVEYMKQSALDLDAFTRELTTFVSQLEQKGKNKSK
jgi:signal transduction histidine kinase